MGFAEKLASQKFQVYTLSKKLDPRPDLEGDSKLWDKLLSLAKADPDPELYGRLHGFRCYGLRIKWTGKAYVLRPEIGPDAWESQEEYEKEREKWLRPYKDKIARLLSQL